MPRRVVFEVKGGRPLHPPGPALGSPSHDSGHSDTSAPAGNTAVHAPAPALAACPGASAKPAATAPVPCVPGWPSAHAQPAAAAAPPAWPAAPNTGCGALLMSYYPAPHHNHPPGKSST